MKNLSESIAASRLVEIVLACGIPVCGFVAGLASHPSRLQDIFWLLPSLLLAGLHVVQVNDRFTSAQGRSRSVGDESGLNFYLRVSLPLLASFAIPAFCAGSLQVKALFCSLLLAVVINWNIYSIAGKNNCLAGICHNFLGGGLHFMLGWSASGFGEAPPIAESLFFALAMSGAGMQHDASHREEDSRNGFRTGAVVFGAERWWSLGFLPLLASSVPLFFSAEQFCNAFGVAFIAYSLMFMVFHIANGRRNQVLFRLLSRLIFASAGLIYSLPSLARLFS